MGDRFVLALNCCYCGELDDDVFYAPTSSSFTFTCEKCNGVNFIKSSLEPIKLEKVTENDIYYAISLTSNFMNERQIKSMAKQTFRDILKLVGGSKNA